MRRGVGLNTKVGTARFLRTLALRLGSDAKPQVRVVDSKFCLILILDACNVHLFNSRCAAWIDRAFRQ